MGFYLDNSDRTYIKSNFTHERGKKDISISGEITELNLCTFNKLPTKAEIKKYLKLELSRYIKDSEYANLKFYGAIAFNSVWGWTGGFEITYFVNKADYDKYINQHFVSEPTEKKLKRTTTIF